ncbi:MAG: ABC transporter ATP-binding protein [Rickettsiaceae bacterium]|nr:ABC transporter ATP-binding protein [Rickettsiaceae bacterium]
MDINKQYKSLLIIKRLLKDHVKPYRKQVSLAIFFMVIVAACSTIIVWLVKPAIDQIFITHDKQMLVLVPLMVIIVYSTKGIAEYFQNYIIKFVGQRILTNLQMQMYEHLLLADLALIESTSSGRLISRFTNDIILMRGAVSNMLVGAAKHLLTVLFLIVMMIYLQPLLSAIALVLFPVAVYPIQKLGRRMRNVSDQVQEELSNYTAKLDETFRSIKVIKSFSGEKIEARRARNIVNKVLDYYKKVAKLDSLSSPIMEILSGIGSACIIWYGGYMVFVGKTTPGELIAFIAAFATVYRPFKSLVALNVNLQEGLTAANRVFNILDTKPVICDVPDGKVINFKKPAIYFNDVSLKFGEKIAVHSFDLKMEPGKTYAFVGRSGSGKTSLANLMVRFYDPTVGEILIDKHNIKNILVSNLRSQISLVTQDVLLFDSTVFENIAYGKPGATKKEVITAAKAADADEFIRAMPDGYDSLVGVQGVTLSGGQRQRLSIARAFLKDAPILILDEATSALDSNSEHVILQALAKLRKGKTTLVITHRLTSVTDVDKIIVMKLGKIIEQGTHQELMKKKKEYHRLYNKQLKEMTENV